MGKLSLPTRHNKTTGSVPACRVRRPGDPAAIRQELKLRDGEILILAVGNLIPRKGHIFLLEALKRLVDEQVDARWRLVIAGGWGGEEGPRLQAFATEHGLEALAHDLVVVEQEHPDRHHRGIGARLTPT